MWASVLVPWYGRATIAVGDGQPADSSSGKGTLNAISSWEAPDAGDYSKLFDYDVGRLAAAVKQVTGK